MKSYNKATFLKSAAKFSDLPPDEGIEIAFVGRSNVGKSSLINALTHRRQLARVSKTPGRTRLINLFKLDDTTRLVDLPGFGYAKVSKEIKENWQAELAAYLEHRDCLKLLVMVMDIRHPFQPIELLMLDWARDAGVVVHVVLNKADKFSRTVANKIFLEVKQRLDREYAHATAQLFSALKKEGVLELEVFLNKTHVK